MPHNLFLQSALVLDKSVRREKRSIQYACAYTSVETSLALLVRSPCTPHPTPHTLHPHLTPYTLHPIALAKRQTLNPKP